MTDAMRKAGGVAALVAAATYVVGFAMLFAVLLPAGYAVEGGDPIDDVAFLVDHRTALYVWNLVIYVVNGVALVPVVVAIHARLGERAPGLARTAAAFGLIWAGLVLASGMLANVGAAAAIDLHDRNPVEAAALWRALATVREGLGGGNELVGGLWVALVGWAALAAGGLSRPLAILSLVIGAAGVLTVIPGLGDLGAVFGLGFIVWFVWAGLVLVRGEPEAA